MQLYSSLSRLYVMPFCSPHLSKNLFTLQAVQRQFTVLIPEMKGQM